MNNHVNNIEECKICLEELKLYRFCNTCNYCVCKECFIKLYNYKTHCTICLKPTINHQVRNQLFHKEKDTNTCHCIIF